MPGFALTFTLVAAAAYAAHNYFFGGKGDDPPPPRDSYYPFGGRDDDPTPPRDSYYPGSSYNHGTTRTHTQQSYRPPPPSASYTYRPPATNAHSQTTARTHVSPDYGRSTHPSVASPRTRTSSQTQSSSAWRQGLHQHSSHFNSVHVHESPEYEYEYPHISSHVPSRVRTGSEPRLSTIVQVVSSDLRSDVEDLDFAKKLREQARRKGREMSEARSRAKSAQKKRLHGAAQAHRQEALVHENAMKELDKRAAKIIFRVNNENCSEGEIDLHGFYVAEAVQFAKDQVQIARSRGDEAVRFIVGKGLHSDAGGAKIRPALEDLFSKRGLSHSLDPRNAGVLIVQLY